MGGKISVDECTSTDNQRVRDCCHLEGETPIEIRIAYQQPRPQAAQRLQNFSHAGGLLHAGHAPGGALRSPSSTRGHPGGSSFVTPRQFASSGFGGGTLVAAGERGQSPWPDGAGGDALRPPMPHGPDRLRLPPPGASIARNDAQVAGDEFDPDTFAAPPDSERGDNAVLAQARLQQALALKALQMQGEDDYFPEIVRVSNGRRHADTSQRAQQPAMEGNDDVDHLPPAWGFPGEFDPMPQSNGLQPSGSAAHPLSDPATPTRL